jgi:hypothetical protein
MLAQEDGLGGFAHQRSVTIQISQQGLASVECGAVGGIVAMSAGELQHRIISRAIHPVKRDSAWPKGNPLVELTGKFLRLWRDPQRHR